MTSRVWAARTSFGSAHNLKYGESRVPLRSFVPEIRKDYATPTWAVFSAARSQRPGAFRNPKDATPKETCPFCEATRR